MTTDINKSNQLVENNIKLVYSFLSSQCYQFSDLSLMSYDDLVQVSSIGLIKASHSFDSSKGLMFSTYAYSCMKKEILNYVRNMTSSCRYDSNTISLSQPLSDESSDEVGDLIPDHNNLEESVLSSISIGESIKQLKPLYKKIILFVMDNPGLTQKEYANYLGTSQTSISRAKKEFTKYYVSV